jgi:spore maturation protein CgeB
VKVLLIHPGASWSTADVFEGLKYGLLAHGVDVRPYRLDTRIEASARTLHAMWRQKKKADPSCERPTNADIFYDAGCRAVTMALREAVDMVLVVSAMYLHPDVLILMKRAGLRTTVLFTESPYDTEREALVARLVDGCWTNERSAVGALREVNPNAGYLPHGWHPLNHAPGVHDGDASVQAHDVVFVGSGFAERLAWFNAIDWTGIDLGLYGTWEKNRLRHSLRDCVREGTVDNAFASALYRRAKVGLNLYRTSKGATTRASAHIAHAESLSPRAYELAACGAFHLSDYRPEVPEVFGDLVPTFRTPVEAEALIRAWLLDDAGRARVSAHLPARVAAASWVDRAGVVLGDIQRLIEATRAA